MGQRFAIAADEAATVAEPAQHRLTVTVRFFARAKELTGVGHHQLDIPADFTVGDVRSQLLARYPDLASIAGSLLASLNGRYAQDDAVVPNRSELAFFPPVSGG